MLVVAGPGSGKTRVVTYRILYLIERLDVHPGRILAMTFTNKAAGEMKRRLYSFLQDRVKVLWVGTFHATCARLLRMYHDEAGIPADYTIIDEDDQVRILKNILKEHFPEKKLLKPSSLRHHIAAAKRSSIGWDKFSGRVRDRDVVKEVYRLYEAFLSAHNALDFGDLIYRTVDMLKKNSGVREKLSDRFVHVLVDEFQDTDLGQYEFVRLLSGRHGNLFVVGDDDQSIYGWRGARVENMLNFDGDYPDCRVVKLQKNYRSTARILNAAMAVINCNRGRTSKKLWTDGPEGCAVRHVVCDSEWSEARVIAREIREFVSSGGGYGGCAVIYRIHAQSRAIEEAMIEHSIPYRIVGGVRFYERMEIKDLIGYLKLSLNPDDDISFARVLNVPPRGFGEETLKKIRQFAEKGGLSLSGAVRGMVKDRALPPRKLGDLENFIDMIEKFRSRSKELLSSELFGEIILAARYDGYLKSAFPENYETRLENVKELHGFIEKFEEENAEASLPLLFDRIALQTSVDNLDMKEDRVTLMTAHSAKGLEFDAVNIAGVEDGLFPYRHPSIYEMPDKQRREEIEEDCRLLYVAMTRAMKQLVLTSAISRRLFGDVGRYRSESPFINGLPDDIIERRGIPYEEHCGIDEKEEEDGLPCGRVKEDGIKIGDSVKHKKFGVGKVVRVIPGDMNKITVKFKSGKLKQIMETFLERT